MSHSKKRNIIIGTLLGVLVLMAIGYAAFNTVLNINGTAGISSNWNILITDISEKKVVGLASTAVDEDGNKKITGIGTLTATFETNLVSPGDSMEYNVTVSNRGSLDAILDKLNVSPSNNPAIKFTVSGIKVGDMLNAETSTTFTIKVEYDETVTGQPTNTTASLQVTLDYVQAGTTGGTVIPPSNDQFVYRFAMDSVKIGDTLESINGATEDYSSLGHNVFVKHKIIDSKVASTEACFIKGGSVQCLKPGDYASTNSTLISIFGEDACEVGDFGTRCKGSVISVLAIPDGDVYVYSDTEDCDIYSDGSSECFG